MTTFKTVEMKAFHCGAIVKRLRFEHRVALARVGRDAHKELRSTFDESCIRRAWFIDGELAAVGGVTGSAASAMGYAWLALSEKATHYPVAILKEVQRQLAAIMVTKRELALTIIGGDEAAKRLAVFLGFHVEDEGPGAPAFTRMGRRSLARHIDTLPDRRIPIGGGYVIGMGYHAPEELGA